MGQIAVNRITNANFFINGKTQLGTSDELNLPDIKAKLAEHKALGMVGSVEFFSGFDKMEMKIKWNSFYRDAFKVAYNPFTAYQIQVRANVENYGSAGRQSQKPLVTFLTGQFKNVPLGNFKQHENVEFESMFNVTRVKQMFDGVALLEYDVLANIYKVDGVDLLAQYKLNIGG